MKASPTDIGSGDFRSSLLNGFIKGLGIGLGLLTTALFAAAASMNVFSAGDTVSAALINKNFEIAAPVGAIMAFYLNECPEGWAPADGTGGTPDLRGVFVRGRNDIGTGARADGNEDPDGSRTVGDLQTDAFQGHYHANSYGNHLDWNSATAAALVNSILGTGSGNVRGPIDGTHGTVRVADETRPRNLAMTYCMRQD